MIVSPPLCAPTSAPHLAHTRAVPRKIKHGESGESRTMKGGQDEGVLIA